MIQGNTIKLRPLRKEDYSKTLEWRNNLELSRMVQSHPFPISDELEIKWYETILTDTGNKSVYFAIENVNQDFIGLVFLNNINWIHRICWFHIIIGEAKARNKGVGYETMKLIIDYAFNTLNLRKIMLEVLIDNKAAIGLYKKVGFVKEGLLKDQYMYNGDVIDSLIMSIVEK